MTTLPLTSENCLIWLFKVASYCFLKSGQNGKFQPQKVPINISERNETKAIHRITFWASNSVYG